MASRQYEAFIEAVGRGPISPDATTLEARQVLESLHGHAISDETRVEWTEYRGVRCAWVDAAPGDDVSSRTLVLCHGGAWIAACGDGYLFYAEMLGRACDARVLLVDYRLAPEHRHPAALEDCAAAYRGLLDSGADPARIGIIGDSCGGNLAVGALMLMRRDDTPMPALGVALGGWFDLDIREPDLRPEPFAHPDFVRARARDYLGDDGDLRDPLAAPANADPSQLIGLPPLLLQVGQWDLTRNGSLRLADRASRAGVDITLEVHPEMVHGFQGLASAGIPESVAALDRVASFVSSRIEKAPGAAGADRE